MNIGILIFLGILCIIVFIIAVGNDTVECKTSIPKKMISAAGFGITRGFITGMIFSGVPGGLIWASVFGTVNPLLTGLESLIDPNCDHNLEDATFD